ncbi:hypothetical protein C1646_795471 [Rhizophagus diaphanus]|nr:hypothetical protein C1646_795471 [Rhizophagus diaphanus] [Rhizophagus sp. MUCL 43196]
MDYSNLVPMDQTGNDFVNNANSIAPAPQNITFEFYIPLPNDRIIHVTYTELNSTEIAQLLNNRIDLSHIPNHRLPYHYNVHRLIRQEIIRQYQQNAVPQQSFDTINAQPIYQACDVSSILPIQQPVDYQQDTQQEYNNTNDATSVPPNSSEDEYNGVQLHQNN